MHNNRLKDSYPPIYRYQSTIPQRAIPPIISNNQVLKETAARSPRGKDPTSNAISNKPTKEVRGQNQGRGGGGGEERIVRHRKRSD